MAANSVFNVSGPLSVRYGGKEKLAEALRLAFSICAGLGNVVRAVGYSVDPDNGLLFHRYKAEGVTAFPSPIGVDGVIRIATDWIYTDEARSIRCLGWDAESTTETPSERGWRVHSGIDGNGVRSLVHNSVIVAVRPVWLWYPK